MSVTISSGFESAVASPAQDFARIELSDVWLRFRRYGHSHPTLKQAVLNAVLRRSYSKTESFWLFRDLNLTVGHGQRLGIIGPNGAGKTTLLMMIAGIYPPAHGRVRVMGRVTPLMGIGAGLNAELSGVENIYLMGALLGFGPRVMAEHVEEILAFSGLKNFAATPVKYYSAGMRTRLAFSIATAIPAEILLLDDVFAGGDAEFLPRATARMRQLMDDSHIVVLVSHQLSLIRRLTTRVIWMGKGKVVRDGPPAEVCRAYGAAQQATEQRSAL